MLPQVPCKLAAGQAYGVKIGGGSVVSKCASSVNHTVPTLDTSVHPQEVRVALHESESTTHIIIHDVDLVVWVGDSEVAQPHHELELSPG